MSPIMLTRRLASGWRRPATSSSASCLISPLGNLSLQTRIATASVPRRPPVLPCNHSFGSAAQPQRNGRKSPIVELPPNLIFDPRAKASPFYGADRVLSEKKKGKRQQDKGNGEQLQTETGPAAAVEKETGDEDRVGDGAVEVGNEVAGAAEEDAEEYEDDYDEDDEEEEEEEEERVLYDLSTRPDAPRAIPLPQRLHVPIVDIKTGEEVGTFHLSERTFGNDPIRVDILQRNVVYQRNKRRGKRNAGALTKTIHYVSGSGRKVRPQKGGGTARAGHSRPAHWRGGAKAHGPKGNVQDYTTKLNKKVRKMGMRHALSQKLKEGSLVVAGDLAAPTHRTKEALAMLENFGIGSAGKRGATALIIDDADPQDAAGGEASVYGGLDVNLKVAVGNLKKVHMMNQLGCNVYSVLKYRKLVLSLAAVRSLEERLERDL